MNSVRTRSHFTLYVECLGLGHLIEIDYTFKLPVAYVVCEMFRHLKSKDNGHILMMKINKLRFYGVKTPESNIIDLSTTITKELCLKTSKFIILFEGPLNDLTPNLIIHISKFLGHDMPNLAKLQRINKKFLSIFKSDDIAFP